MVRRLATDLTEREREAMRLRDQGMTFRKIGEMMRVSGERARQLFCSGVRKLEARRLEEDGARIVREVEESLAPYFWQSRSR